MWIMTNLTFKLPFKNQTKNSRAEMLHLIVMKYRLIWLADGDELADSGSAN